MTVDQLRKALEGKPGNMDVYIKQTIEDIPLSLAENVEVVEASFSEDEFGPVLGKENVLIITDDF